MNYRGKMYSMNVIIVATNRSRQPVPVIPLGACLVAQSLEMAGHQVRLLDLMFEPDPSRALSRAFEESDPDMVGLSVRNLDNNDMGNPEEYVGELTALVRKIERHSNAPIALGGPAVGVMPEGLLRATRARLAVLGDGEAVFPMLIDSLITGLSFSDTLETTPRVAWIENGNFRRSTSVPLKLHPDLMVPDFQRWVDLRRYLSHLAAVPVQSKRGCPFECIYCTYGISEGKDYRLFPPEEVADAVRGLGARGIRDVEFVDNVFNSPYEHAMDICQDLARSPSGADLQTIELNPAFVDRELLDAMRRAGFTGVGITAESTSDKVLKNLGKGYTPDQVWHASEAMRQSPIPCFWLFLIGGPGETRESFRETVRFARTAARPMDVVFFNVGLRIYPGTHLERTAREEGSLAASPREMLLPTFYFSPELDLSWVREELSSLTRVNLNFIHSASLSHPWLPAINRLGHLLRVKQPLWRHTRTIRRMVRTLGKDIR